MTVIETSRLILSELKTEDAAFILKLYNDQDFISYIGDKGIRSIKDAEKFIGSSDFGASSSLVSFSSSRTTGLPSSSKNKQIHQNTSWCITCIKNS